LSQPAPHEPISVSLCRKKTAKPSLLPVAAVSAPTNKRFSSQMSCSGCAVVVIFHALTIQFRASAAVQIVPVVARRKNLLTTPAKDRHISLKSGPPSVLLGLASGENCRTRIAFRDVCFSGGDLSFSWSSSCPRPNLPGRTRRLIHRVSSPRSLLPLSDCGCGRSWNAHRLSSRDVGGRGVAQQHRNRSSRR